ncbi:MAG: S9 family peptidase [Crenarchaeota archaeon]|nr:S9 family peptidase [Thermoproteota archaeon]
MDSRSRAPLIPRRILFGNPDRVQARVSPDGTRISYLAPFNGVLNVWVAPVDEPDNAKPVTNDTYRGIRFHIWAYTNEHVLYIQDKAGDENWRIYSVSLKSGESKDLTPLEGVQARIENVSHKSPDEILVSLNDRSPEYHDLYTLNIMNGERRLVKRNDGFMGFITDDDYRVHFASLMTPDGGTELLKPTEEGTWEPFIRISMEDALTTTPIGVDKTGKILYMTDSRGRNTSALVALNIETGEKTILAFDEKSDVEDVLVHPVEKHVQAVAFNYERRRWNVVDDSIERDFSYLEKVCEGDLDLTSRTLRDDKWIVSYVVDDGPARYYLYDREAGEARFLFTDRKALEQFTLAKMHSASVKSRDGLNLVCYYTLPVGSDQDGDGRPDAPLPMVLMVHGGPWARDRWGFNPYHQWLANRGYAVLSVNFRGSTGFGKQFVNAGNMEWGRRMHDDLIDAVDWAIREGIADSSKIAIFGGSYGGYATLVGLTFTPDRFACGVDIVGPSNLVTLLESIPPYWKPMVELFATRVGDHRTEEGRALLRERSPLTYVDRIRKPLLIGQGANDPRVKRAESDQIVKAMREKGISVTYVVFPDEGHGFARPENRLSFNAVAEAFLSRFLGGLFEPIGEDFEGSTITVETGVSEVPGLEQALRMKKN